MTKLIKAEYSPSLNACLHTYSNGQVVGFANIVSDPQERADRHAAMSEADLTDTVNCLIPCDEETLTKVRNEASDWKVIYEA